jgi:hypothetical protein
MIWGTGLVFLCMAKILSRKTKEVRSHPKQNGFVIIKNNKSRFLTTKTPKI